MTRGRTYRGRQKKRDPVHRPPVSCEDESFWRLQRWANAKGDHVSGGRVRLKLVWFPQTSCRGLMAMENVPAGSVLFRIPSSVILLPQQAPPPTAPAAPHPTPPLPLLFPEEALTFRLLLEDRKGSESNWNWYLRTLPRDFSSHPLSHPHLSEFLEGELKEDFQKECQRANRCYAKLRTQFSDRSLTYSEFLWAWLCVLTRAVHVPGFDTQAMVPMLDLVNHDPFVSTELRVRYEQQQRVVHNAHVPNGKVSWLHPVHTSPSKPNFTLELVTHSSFRRGKEVFITYGDRSNSRLWLEYGFILPSNPASVLSWSPMDLSLRLKEVYGELLPLKEVPSWVRGIQCGSSTGPTWMMRQAVAFALGLSSLEEERVLSACDRALAAGAMKRVLEVEDRTLRSQQDKMRENMSAPTCSGVPRQLIDAAILLYDELLNICRNTLLKIDGEGT
ncbi:unnamed protein product [Cyprideis torosa]|uniref:Uncharacterized protein n=1 Tax=Cyprideis torosa TaxID=163714 RepID=A0A7R8W8H5_9CRUS|nr:unnamed protein product [Cyprideis torosa]CAG0883803.1 unnamed protein product [Cyprideis torosa]